MGIQASPYLGGLPPYLGGLNPNHLTFWVASRRKTLESWTESPWVYEHSPENVAWNPLSQGAFGLRDTNIQFAGPSFGWNIKVAAPQDHGKHEHVQRETTVKHLQYRKSKPMSFFFDALIGVVKTPISSGLGLILVGSIGINPMFVGQSGQTKKTPLMTSQVWSFIWSLISVRAVHPNMLVFQSWFRPWNLVLSAGDFASGRFSVRSPATRRLCHRTRV